MLSARLTRGCGVPHAGEVIGFGTRPYSAVGFSLRFMAFTITYKTTAVTITVKTNQISKLVMSSILPLGWPGVQCGGRTCPGCSTTT